MVRLTHRIVVMATAVAAAGVLTTGAADADRHSHLLWKVTGPESAEVYLLGSIHALPRDAYPLPAAVERAYDAARVVAFEVDLGDVEAIGNRMFAAGALGPEERLEDVLSPETRALMESHLEGAGLSMGAFSAMKPWMAALTLTTLELMKAGYSPESGVDLHFARRAAADGKRVEAFETAELQVGLFADMTRDEGEAFLRYTLHDLETVVPQLAEITRAWREGDEAAIIELLTEAFEEEPELFEKLVTERNKAWLPQVKALLAGTEDALVVVGALHLVGPTGLVSQLEAAGYAVERL
jgi:uncharacterized protein YbaP (TraB family)